MAEPSAQLAVLQRLFTLCEARDVPLWLLGGWGIDALLGRITREHEDIDLVTPLESRRELRRIIEELPGQITSDESVNMRFKSREVRVEVRFFQRWQDGLLVLDLDSRDDHVYPTPPGSFPPEYNGYLPNFRCRSVSWEALYVAKAGFCHFRPEVALREKDVADLAFIEQHLSQKEKKHAQHYFAGVPRAPLI